MDLNNRSFRPNQQPGARPNNEQAVEPQHPRNDSTDSKKKKGFGSLKNKSALNVTYVFLLFSVTIVIVGVLLSLVFFKSSSREERFVDTSKYQAIFLNNGQVYFGHINELNKNYLSISDIYYLRVNQQVQPDQKQASQNDVSLVKLGCELHGPQDNMVANRDQVTFWENLKDDGQVVKAVNDYKKANPNGQNCEQQAQTPAPASDNSSGTAPANQEDSSANNDTSGDAANNTPPAAPTENTPTTP